MKKVLLIIFALGFGFWGCSENTTLTGPENVQSQQSFLKINSGNSSTLMKTTTNGGTIFAAEGGKIKIDLESGSTSVKGRIKFKKKNIFTENGSKVESADITIDLAVNDDVAALDFGPSGLKLDKPAILTVKFTGIDFAEGATAEDFNFLYLSGNELAQVEYKKIIIDKKHRWIKVVNAELTHFSRYGFTK